MRRLGEQARKEYETKYTADANYLRLLEIYQQVIDKRTVAALPLKLGIPLPEQSPRPEFE